MGEQVWKDTGDRLQRPCFLSRVEHDGKVRSRKQRTDIGKYSFGMKGRPRCNSWLHYTFHYCYCMVCLIFVLIVFCIVFIVCSFVCCAMFEHGVLCLIVVPLPPGKTPFADKVNNNDICCGISWSFAFILRCNLLSANTWIKFANSWVAQLGAICEDLQLHVQDRYAIGIMRTGYRLKRKAWNIQEYFPLYFTVKNQGAWIYRREIVDVVCTEHETVL
jgi:hypothetical protein